MRVFSVFIGIILMLISFNLSGQEAKNWQVFPAKMEIMDASVADDKIWLGTDNGLYELNGNGTVKNKYDKLNGLPSNHIRAAAVADGGGSWVGTYAAGIKKVEDSNVMDMPELDEAVEGTLLHAIERIKGTDKIGILTEESYHVYDGEEVQTHELPASPTGFGSWNETHFKPISDSSFWISTKHSFKYFNGQEYESQMQNNFNPYRDIALAYDDQGRLWASHEERLAYRENGQWHWTDTNQIGLKSKILCMSQDENGNLYVASENSMAVYKNGQWQKWANLEEGFWDDKDDWILTAKSGNFYFPGKQGKKLAHFDGTQATSYELEAHAFDEPSHISASKEKIWLKTNAPNAIYYMDEGQWQELNVPDQYQSSITGDLVAIDDQKIWVKGDSTLFRYKAGQWKEFTSRNSNLPKLSYGDRIKAIEGRFWVSTNQGLRKFENGTFVLPEEPFKNQKTTPFTVTKDAIWFFDQQTETLKKWENGQMTEFNGEWHKGTTGNTSPRFIKTGPKGQVWLSSKSGLAYYDGNEWVFPEALNDIEAGFWTGIHDFETIDSVTYAVATSEGIALSHKGELQWIQKSNSPLPYKRVTRLAVTGNRQVASIGGYDNDMSIFELTRPGQDRSTNNDDNSRENSVLKHYPNPVKDELHLELPSYSGKSIAYKLLNSKGQLVKQGTLKTTGKQPIKVKTLDQGLYFLNVQAGSINEIRKILKK